MSLPKIRPIVVLGGNKPDLMTCHLVFTPSFLILVHVSGKCQLYKNIFATIDQWRLLGLQGISP